MQGYYRRADALYALGKIKQAYADFKRAAKVAPKDPDLRKKLLECEKEVKRIRFEEALSLPVSIPSFLALRPSLRLLQSCWSRPSHGNHMLICSAALPGNVDLHRVGQACEKAAHAAPWTALCSIIKIKELKCRTNVNKPQRCSRLSATERRLNPFL